MGELDVFDFIPVQKEPRTGSIHTLDLQVEQQGFHCLRGCDIEGVFPAGNAEAFSGIGQHGTLAIEYKPDFDAFSRLSVFLENSGICSDCCLVAGACYVRVKRDIQAETGRIRCEDHAVQA